VELDYRQKQGILFSPPYSDYLWGSHGLQSNGGKGAFQGRKVVEEGSYKPPLFSGRC